MNRKEFLKLIGLAGLEALTSPSRVFARNNPVFNISHDLSNNQDPKLAPFYHGVASGDPSDNDVLLWTRVSPEISNINTAKVKWALFSDPKQQHSIQHGVVTTDSSKDFTVKVIVKNLKPDTYYWYRFSYNGKHSIVGRTKTLPSNPESVNLVAISCNAYEGGYFSAFEAIAQKQEKIDAVVHLGDFIYEGYFPKYFLIPERTPMPPKKCIALQDYRTRYAQYRLDEQLRHAMQMHPFIHIWDDHELANNDYMDGAQAHNPTKDGSYEVRKRNAVQAYFEWIPIKNNEKQIYREMSFGNLLTLLLLEDRIDGRTKQEKMSNPDFYGDDRHILGKTQMDWLTDNLKNSQAHWKLIGNPILFSTFNYAPVWDQMNIELDSWSGYPYEQNLLKSFIEDYNISNTVFVSGDSHCSWFFDIYGNKTNNVIAHEIGVHAISSGNWGREHPRQLATWNKALNENNPQLTYVDLSGNGFVDLHITKSTITSTWNYIDVLSKSPAILRNVSKKVLSI